PAKKTASTGDEKEGWVGGWRNPGLRKSGRPQQPNEPPPKRHFDWDRPRPPQVFDDEGHLVREDGTCVEACAHCGYLTGAAWRLGPGGVHEEIRPRAKPPCNKARCKTQGDSHVEDQAS